MSATGERDRVSVDVRRVPWDDADGTRLRTAQQVEVSARYGVPDSEPGPKPTASDITAFFVAYVNDRAVGCAGLRRLGPTEAEIKRMYVDPAARGTGVSVALLATLETFGRQEGWARLVLETGDRQPDAVRLYEREGYARIPNFGYYADSASSLCYEKLLFAVDPSLDTICEGCQ
ncbi:GNAT family N-acetyltransferase [soil metagenome]